MVLVSYEDSPARMVARVKRMGADVPSDVHVLRNPAPLFEADPRERGKARPGRQWEFLWRQVGRIKPSMLILDPASAALADVSAAEGGPVRALFTLARQEAELAGVGVLIVAHDTKQARTAVKAGEDPGAGAVAGSATWYDAARGVLYLRRAENNSRVLECLKSNYGRAGWTANLRERLDGGVFVGFDTAERGSEN